MPQLIFFDDEPDAFADFGDAFAGSFGNYSNIGAAGARQALDQKFRGRELQESRDFQRGEYDRRRQQAIDDEEAQEATKRNRSDENAGLLMKAMQSADPGALTRERLRQGEKLSTIKAEEDRAARFNFEKEKAKADEADKLARRQIAQQRATAYEQSVKAKNAGAKLEQPDKDALLILQTANPEAIVGMLEPLTSPGKPKLNLLGEPVMDPAGRPMMEMFNPTQQRVAARLVTNLNNFAAERDERGRGVMPTGDLLNLYNQIASTNFPVQKLGNVRRRIGEDQLKLRRAFAAIMQQVGGGGADDAVIAEDVKQRLMMEFGVDEQQLVRLLEAEI